MYLGTFRVRLDFRLGADPPAGLGNFYVVSPFSSGGDGGLTLTESRAKVGKPHSCVFV